MSFLPPAIPPRTARGLPMPAVVPKNTLSYSGGAMSSLPVPTLVPSEMPKTPAARAAAIEHIKAEAKSDAAEKRKGRPTKAEVKKAEKAAMSERIRGLLETKPSKKDVEEYIRNRLKELSD